MPDSWFAGLDCGRTVAGEGVPPALDELMDCPGGAILHDGKWTQCRVVRLYRGLPRRPFHWLKSPHRDHHE